MNLFLTSYVHMYLLVLGFNMETDSYHMQA